MVRFRRGVLMFLSLSVALAGCESLKTSKPILPIKEYERMLVGRLDADYVGTKNCLAACHAHDSVKQDFDDSTMGAQLSAESGLPLVDCESCHGPGSLAIEGITPEKVAEDAKAGVQTACNYETLIDIKNLPAQARSLICLKCHTANATFNLHNWTAGIHNINDVSCSECHPIHAGPNLIVKPQETFRMCFKCHKAQEAEFMLPSHHPVHEQRVFCVDCHDPHGTIVDKQLREDTVKEVCVRCHAEKEGPFVFEHAENMEECTSCHRPHASVYNNMLAVGMPFLCLQCHVGHRTSATASAATKQEFYTRCTDCHSQIHGTDIPSASGAGAFTQ